MKTSISLFFLISILLIACNSKNANHKSSQLQSSNSFNNKVKHSLFNSKATLYLDTIYERLNVNELVEVAKQQPKTSFINRIFNKDRLKLAQSLGAQYFVFIDTSTYSNILHFERLNKMMPISREAASIIGGLFKKEIQNTDPSALVSVRRAKFGSAKTFQYGYYQMMSESPELETFSNHFAISSSKGSYILYNISLDDLDLLYLKKQLIFNE